METMMETVSRDTHAPVVTVQIKLYIPAVVRPETVDDALEGLLIVALLLVVQSPVPGEGLEPLNVAFPVDVQIF